MEKNTDGSKVIWQGARKYDATEYSDDNIDNILPSVCIMKIKPNDTQTGNELIKVLLAGETEPRTIELWEVYYINIMVKKVFENGSGIDINDVILYA